MATASTVLSYLFMYSIAMFTLPFAAFYGTKYLVKEYLDVEEFTNTIISVVMSVVAVHVVIILYVRHAVHEMRADKEFEPHIESSHEKLD